LGHLQSLSLPKSAKWRTVVDLIDAGQSISEIVAAAMAAAETATRGATKDPAFRAVSELLVTLPLEARGPGFQGFLEERWISAATLSDLLTGIARNLDRVPAATDLGEMSRLAYITALGTEVEMRLPGLFEPTPADLRAALGQMSSGQGFSSLARRFFAELTRRTLAYYLSRELASHTGDGRRFADDRDRVAFDRALAAHTWQASGIVAEFAAGWYGKTVWQERGLSSEKISNFSGYAFKKLRDELARRRDGG
jgi:hypothetical protein